MYACYSAGMDIANKGQRQVQPRRRRISIERVQKDIWQMISPRTIHPV